MERSTIFKNGKPSISIRAIEIPWLALLVITRGYSKPPFSYGFPMVFLWFSYVSHNQRVASPQIHWTIGSPLRGKDGPVPWPEFLCFLMFFFTGGLNSNVWRKKTNGGLPEENHRKTIGKWRFTLWLCQNSYGKSPCLMGKLTISTGPFSIANC